MLKIFTQSQELKQNRSESINIQIISKQRGIYKVIKTVGCATQRHAIERLKHLARQEIERLQSQPQLFKSEQDELIEDVIGRDDEKRMISGQASNGYL